MGKILDGKLSPFMAPRADLRSQLGRVKVQIHNDIANVTLPIYEEDSINNRLFRQFEEHHIRNAKLVL